MSRRSRSKSRRERSNDSSDLAFGVFFAALSLYIIILPCFVFAVIVFVLARWDCIATYMSRRGFALFNLVLRLVSMFLGASHMSFGPERTDKEDNHNIHNNDMKILVRRHFARTFSTMLL